VVLCRTGACFLFLAPAPTELSSLSLHDALPISASWHVLGDLYAEAGLSREATASYSHGGDDASGDRVFMYVRALLQEGRLEQARSEEHTSELQSRENLVCRLLLEKKKKIKIVNT